MTGNGGGTKNGVAHYGGLVTGAETWPAGVDWYLLGDLQIGTPTSIAPSLAVRPGVNVKIGQSLRIVIYGTLTATGTAAQPIVFTSAQITPTPGYWLALVFVGGGTSNSRLEYVTVSYGGQYNANSGLCSVYVDSGSPTFDHLTVLSSATAGVRVLGASAAPTFTNSRIEGSAWSGFQLDTPASATVADTELVNNTGYAFRTSANARLLGLTGLTVTGNGGGTGNGVAHYGGTITGAETWPSGVDWYLLGDLQIGTPTSIAPSLAVSPGVNVKIGPSLRILIYGTLTATGTATQPIVFTSAQTTPTPGYWLALVFVGGGTSNSRLEYVTVAYGGQSHPWSGYCSVYVDSGSPSFDHLTVLSSATAGVRVLGASAAPTFTNSRIEGSAWSGFQLDTPASATITDTEIINNTSYAFQTSANARLLGLTGLTVTGNGGGMRNGVAHYGGTITGAETWLAGVVWYLLEDLQVGTPTSTAPSLTVSPGATVKMNQSQRIVIYGTLTAAGTGAQPILFTSAQPTPTPGYWRSLVFVGAPSSNSRLSYVTVSFGGQNHSWSGFASVYADGSSPAFDHLTISDSATCAVRAGNSTLAIRNAAFVRNAGCGVENFTPGIPFIAKLSYWDSPAGPSGQGTGTGESVSGGVGFEPWLTAMPSSPNFVVDVNQRNRTFNPSIGTVDRLDFTTALAGSWTVTYRNSGGAAVKSFSGSGSAGSLAWDGRDEGSVTVAGGTYNYDLQSVGGSGETTTVARGIAVVDGSRQLTISGPVLSPEFFSPNGDAIQDGASYSGAFSFDDVAWQIAIKTVSNTVVRTSSGQGSGFAFTWDGRSDVGLLQPDGVYRLELTASVGSASAGDTKSATLDNTPPTAVIASPAATLLSNVYQGGIADVVVTGSAGDLNLLSWTLDYGTGGSPTAWTPLRNAITTPVWDGQLALWPTLDRSNELYSLRLRVYDKAGNVTTSTATPTIGNFKVAQNVLQLESANGGTVTYTSTVPFALTETLLVKNEAGAIVRTLIESLRQAGTYSDVWNGRADSGPPVPDGLYRYIATVTDGSHTMTWDLSSQFFNDYLVADYPVLQSYDPFNNRPLAFTYGFPQVGRVAIAVSTLDAAHVPPNCNPPNYCLKNEFESSGAHTVAWAGVDTSGAFLTGLRRITVIKTREDFPKNGIVVFGTRPTVTNVRVTPPVFGPAVGTQVVAFDLSTYQGSAADAELTFLNQESLSVLRRVVMAGVQPGHVTWTWDGRADNGMLVAPGPYTVTVKVLDSLGNTVQGQILAQIQY